MLTCEQFIDHLLDFTEGDLPSETNRLCREHSALCKKCAGYLDSYQKTIAVEKAAFDPDLAIGSAAHRDPASKDRYELPEELVQSILTAAGAVS